MIEPEVIIGEPQNDAYEVLKEIGVDTFLDLMDKAAGRVSRNTPLGPDQSWDDPEEYQMEGVILAHGYEALDRYLKEGGSMPKRWRNKEG